MPVERGVWLVDEYIIMSCGRVGHQDQDAGGRKRYEHEVYMTGEMGRYLQR